MIEWIQFFVLVLACVYVITESTVFSTGRMLLRRMFVLPGWPTLAYLGISWLYCPACMGFWVGATVYALQRNFFVLGDVFFAGCAGMIAGRVWSEFIARNTLATVFEAEVLGDPLTRPLYHSLAEGNHESTQEG